MMRTVAFLLASMLLASSALAAPNDNKALQRQTRYGPVVGVDDSGMSGTHAWKGVPFAAPPVGALRWAAERVNDFAAPGDINLVCGAAVC